MTGRSLPLAPVPPAVPGAVAHGRRGRLRRGLTLLAMTLVAVLAGPGGAAAGADELLPDLIMLRPSEIHLCRSPNQVSRCPKATLPHRRYLRFSATMANVGAGPFELHGERPDASTPLMDVEQHILQSDSSFRIVPTSAHQRFATGDGHFHWHVVGMERYELLRIASPLPGPLVGHKYGFCFFDGVTYDSSIVGHPLGPMYSFQGCGVPSASQDDLTTDVGLSVGWGDIYPWYFAGQHIDISDVPDGRYLLCLTADPSARFIESDDGDNQSWAVIQLKGVTKKLIRRGRSPCQGQLHYPLAGARGGLATIGAGDELDVPEPAEAGVPDALARRLHGPLLAFTCRLPGAWAAAG